MTEQNLAVVADLAREGAMKHVTLPDGRELLVVAPGMQVVDKSDPRQVFAPPPPRRRGAVKLNAKHSFIDYVTAFNDPAATRLFANLDAGAIVAALDYHDPGLTHGGHVEHTATLTLQLAEEWKRWTGIDKKLMKQAEFARWLEENLADIDAPNGADVLEVVRDMSAKKNVNFASAVRLQNGDTAFEYVEETRASSKSGTLDVPTMFVLRIPVWYGEPAVEQRAFLRWNIDSGQLAIGIELHRPAYVKQAVFEAVGRDIVEATGKPLHYGVM